MLLRTLGVSLLGDLLEKHLSVRGVIRDEKEQLELVMDLKNFESSPINKI